MFFIENGEDEKSENGIKVKSFFRYGAKIVLKKGQACYFEAKCAKCQVI